MHTESHNLRQNITQRAAGSVQLESLLWSETTSQASTAPISLRTHNFQTPTRTSYELLAFSSRISQILHSLSTKQAEGMEPHMAKIIRAALHSVIPNSVLVSFHQND